VKRLGPLGGSALGGFSKDMFMSCYDKLDEKLLPVGFATAVGLNLCPLMKLLRQLCAR
jgi:hypothetical protein